MFEKQFSSDSGTPSPTTFIVSRFFMGWSGADTAVATGEENGWYGSLHLWNSVTTNRTWHATTNGTAITFSCFVQANNNVDNNPELRFQINNAGGFMTINIDLDTGFFVTTGSNTFQQSDQLNFIYREANNTVHMTSVGCEVIG